MANTVIALRKSGVSGNIPNPVSLVYGELSINYADGIIYYKRADNTIGTVSSAQPGGLNQEIQFNDSGSFGASDNLTFDKTTGLLSTYDAHFANSITVHTKIYAGIATELSTELPNVIAQFASNSASYTQVNQENINPNGSADWVATADVGTDTTFYVDLGIQNSSRTDGTIKPLDSYLLAQGNTGQVGGNLVIGTISGSSVVETRFIAGGYEENNVAFKTARTGLTLPTDKRLNYANNSGIRVYQYYNDATGSLDTVFV